MRPPKARRIVIAAYEGVSLLDLAGPLEAFQVASRFGGSRESRVTYECSVVSIRGGPLKTADGVELKQFPPDLNLRDSQTVSDDGDSVH